MLVGTPTNTSLDPWIRHAQRRIFTFLQRIQSRAEPRSPNMPMLETSASTAYLRVKPSEVNRPRGLLRCASRRCALSRRWKNENEKKGGPTAEHSGTSPLNLSSCCRPPRSDDRKSGRAAHDVKALLRSHVQQPDGGLPAPATTAPAAAAATTAAAAVGRRGSGSWSWKRSGRLWKSGGLWATSRVSAAPATAATAAAVGGSAAATTAVLEPSGWRT